jgi:hypothetical protein
MFYMLCKSAQLSIIKGGCFPPNTQHHFWTELLAISVHFQEVVRDKKNIKRNQLMFHTNVSK